MSAYLSRCFMGTAEEIAAHHRLVADAKAVGAAAERARICAWLQSRDWNSMQDWNGDPFEGDHNDVAQAIASCLERGEHVVTK